MQSYKAHAIILKRTNLGEADRIITAFSQEFGKIKFVAKGVRKLKSKIAGSVEPFYFSDLIIVPGKSLDILTSANITKTPIEDPPNLATIKLASYFAEFIDKTIPEYGPNSELYNLLAEVLQNINTQDKDLLKFYFESRFYQLSGLLPELSVCVRCGKKPESGVYFSVNAGGILDSTCQAVHGDAIKISKEIAKTWRFAAENNFSSLKKINLSEVLRSELFRISKKYLRREIQGEFRSDSI